MYHVMGVKIGSVFYEYFSRATVVSGPILIMSVRYKAEENRNRG
jgi:hypothetical protein